MKLDLLLFGSIESGPFFALLEKKTKVGGDVGDGGDGGDR
jgi:hypothetical protein